MPRDEGVITSLQSLFIAIYGRIVIIKGSRHEGKMSFFDEEIGNDRLFEGIRWLHDSSLQPEHPSFIMRTLPLTDVESLMIVSDNVKVFVPSTFVI